MHIAIKLHDNNKKGKIYIFPDVLRSSAEQWLKASILKSKSRCAPKTNMLSIMPWFKNIYNFFKAGFPSCSELKAYVQVNLTSVCLATCRIRLITDPPAVTCHCKAQQRSEFPLRHIRGAHLPAPLWSCRFTGLVWPTSEPWLDMMSAASRPAHSVTRLRCSRPSLPTATTASSIRGGGSSDSSDP